MTIFKARVGQMETAAVAVHTAAFVGDHHFQLIVVSMYFVGALSFNRHGRQCARGVADDLVLRI